MSRVFVAEDTALGRRVVVKVLPPELAAALSVERFRREIQLAARLQHAHIVPLLAAGEAGGLLYYTMPLVEGETLQARLARRGEMPLAEAVSVLRDVATALSYAHAHGVVHRDIKPANVLLTEHDALVADFGVAKAVRAAAASESTLTSVGVSLGTPAYMAPEQGVGDPNVDQRADLYAFGVVAYEMLTGAVPFTGRSVQALIAAHVTEAPEPLARRRPSVPPPLADLVMRCLEKRPADRPQSADEIVRALDAVAVSSSGGAARAATPSGAGRRRRAAAVVATLVVAAGALLALSRSCTGAPVDHNAVAVLPFRVVNADTTLRPLREGMLDLVSAKLTGRIHAIDTRTVLAAWRRAGGSATTDLTRDAALALGRRLGAGAVLQGDIVGAPGEIVLNATLVGVPGGTERRATARGAPARLAVLVDSVVGALLALEAGEGSERATSLAGVPIEALQSYLLGRALDREGRYGAAVDAYARALAVDSTFALAGLRLWVTADNWASDPRAQLGRRVALRYASRLGERDRLLLGPTADPDRPRSCRERLREQERAVGVAPDMPDLWYVMGETLAHCGLAMGVENAEQRALGSFNRALALDSTYTPAYEHLPVLYAWLGDTANARRSDEIVRRDTTSEWLGFYELFTPDAARVRDGMARLERGPPALAAAAIGSALGLDYVSRLTEAESLLAHLREGAVTTRDRARVTALTRIVALDRGQPSRAAAAERASGAPLDPAAALLAAALWDADTTTVAPARSAAVAALGAAAPADSAAREAWVSNVFALAAWELTRRDTSHTRRAVVALRAVPAPPDAPWKAGRARRLALILDAHLAAFEGRADAAAVLAAADSMLRDAPGGRYVESAGNLLIAPLWERAGDTARAYDAVNRFRTGTVPPSFLSTILREQGRLGALTGHREEAIRAYRHYLSLRSDAEPAFAAHLASVRQELARLERSSAGR